MRMLKKFFITAVPVMGLLMTGCGISSNERSEDILSSAGQEEIGQIDSGDVLPENKDSEVSQTEDGRSSFLFAMSTSYSIGNEDFNGGYVQSGTMKTGDRAVLVKCNGTSYATKIERMALYRDDDKGNPTPVNEVKEGPLVFVWLEENTSNDSREQPLWLSPDELQYGDILLGTIEWEQGIPIEFPFEESEEYTLAFAPQEKEKEQGEFRLYDKDGAILQRIPYGVYGLPYYYVLCKNDGRNLAFFPDEESREGHLWEWDGEQFSESETNIKNNMTSYSGDLLVTEETETMLTREIYRPHRNDRQAEEIRRYVLQKDKGELEIWDCLDQKSLYKETVSMKEDGTPVNEEYYQVMFTEGLYPWAWEGEEEETSVFVDISSLRSSDELYTEYESREAFLTDYGFTDGSPIYQYYDRMGNLRFELYKDESTDLFCGITYRYFYNSERQKCSAMSGFAVDDIMAAKWEDDTYSVMSRPDSFDHEERIEYTDDRRPTYFIAEESDGTGENEGENVMLMEIDYIYRDDGTLYDRHYWHNPYLFSTTRQSESSLYDEKERLVYQNSYITHGTLEDYYIYLDESDKPAYHLEFDYDLGPVPVTSMERYQ